MRKIAEDLLNKLVVEGILTMPAENLSQLVGPQKFTTPRINQKEIMQNLTGQLERKREAIPSRKIEINQLLDYLAFSIDAATIRVQTGRARRHLLIQMR